MRIIALVTICALSTLAITMTAQATLLTSGSCQVTFTGGGEDFCTQGSGESSVPIVSNDGTTASIPDDGFNGAASGSASYFAAADYGRLGVRVTGSATSAVPSVNQTGQIRNARAQGDASAAFLDVLSLLGAPAGTEAVINFSLPIDGQIASSSDNGVTGGFARVDWNLNGTVGCWDTLASDPNCQSTATQGSFTATVGTPFLIVVNLQIPFAFAESTGAFVGACPDCTWLSGFASIDAAFDHTLLSFFDPVDPTLRLISESGHDYAMPTSVAVSEPASMALVLLGLLLIGMWGRSRSVHNSNARVMY